MSASITWPTPAIATGVGSMPGHDPVEATNIVAGEFAAFPHLVELPARGPGADPVGRTACLLADVDRSFEVETTPSGWRLGHAGQRELRRSRAWFSQDLDALEQHIADFRGPVKVQAVGPWTLACAIEDPLGESLLRDTGAVADLASALGEVLVDVVERVRRSIPGAEVVVQLDESSIPRVLAGRVKMSSGRLTHRSVEPATVERHLAVVLSRLTCAGATPAVRCSADHPPLDLLRGAGARVLGVDLSRKPPEEDALPRAWEAGVGLLMGCVPVRGEVPSMSDTALSAPLRRFMDESGFGEVPGNVAITPTRGLAEQSPDSARAIIAACDRVGRIVRDDSQEAIDV